MSIRYELGDEINHILEIAQDEAKRLGHDWIGTEHILLAILASGRGPAYEVLRATISDPSQLRSEIVDAAGPGVSLSSGATFPWTPRTIKVLNRTSEEIAVAGERKPLYGSAFLLLSLLAEGGIAGEALEKAGLTVEGTRKHIKRIFPKWSNASIFGEPLEGSQSPYPALRNLARLAGAEQLSIAVVADLDHVPADIAGEFLGALDALHRAWGGAGLRLESGAVGTTSTAGERV